MDTGMDGSWLKESRYGCTGDDVERFIHGMDGDSPAVRLMLLVEKAMHAPRIRRRPNSMIGRMDGGSETDRRMIADIAAGMDVWSKRSDHGADIYGDFPIQWLLDPGDAASAACSRRLRGKPTADHGDDGSMMSLMAFAVRNEQWASRFADTLASFIVATAIHDHDIDAESMNAEASGYRLADEGTVPARCIQTLACMICSAFNDGHHRQTGDDMVSPLSVTLSMIVSRCLDAPTAASLPMVGDGMYGPERDPMDDLYMILRYSAPHPHKSTSPQGFGNGPGVLTIIPGGMFIGETASNVICLQDRRADDAGMFALLTHPGFPDHMGRAVKETGRLFSRICRAMPERSPANAMVVAYGNVFHFPLLPYHTLTRIAAASPRIIELMRDPGTLRVAMRCDHDPEERSYDTPAAQMTGDGMVVSKDEGRSQTRGMMMADRIINTDWSHYDIDAAIGIIKAISPPGYDAVRDPMDFIRDRPGLPMIQHWQVELFIASCMDADRMDLASSMVGLADFMDTINRMIGRGGTEPLDWGRHDDVWSMLMTGSMLRAMLEDDRSGLPDDFIANDFLARVSLKPYRRDGSMDSRLSRFVITLHPERNSGESDSSYVLLIDWGA